MIQTNIRRIKQHITTVCAQAKRNSDDITLVAVSKTRTIVEITQALAAGITAFGENRVQEALLKYRALQALHTQLPRFQWHMVGHLQTNKVKDAVLMFDLIHSVDSLHLAQTIDKQASVIGKRQRILIEVKTSPEPTKHGVAPEEAVSLVSHIQSMEHVKVEGLMTISPLGGDTEVVRECFRTLRELQQRLGEELSTQSFPVLSMGMSDDYVIALEEGSTMLRIGRALFEG